MQTEIKYVLLALIIKALFAEKGSSMFVDCEDALHARESKII